jgi:hypothetical protein
MKKTLLIVTLAIAAVPVWAQLSANTIAVNQDTLPGTIEEVMV